MRIELFLSHHGFTMDLCKDRNGVLPPKLEVRYSFDFWGLVVSRVCVRFDVESDSDVSEEAMELKAFKDWLQPKEGKVRFVGKGMNPICVGIWSSSSNKLLSTIIWDITSSYDLSIFLPFFFNYMRSFSMKKLVSFLELARG